MLKLLRVSTYHVNPDHLADRLFACAAKAYDADRERTGDQYMHAAYDILPHVSPNYCCPTDAAMQAFDALALMLERMDANA